MRGRCHFVSCGDGSGVVVKRGAQGVGFGGPQPTIVLSQTDEPKAGKLRLYIDANATDREQGDEPERLTAAGARSVDICQSGSESWHVLVDPEGNEFCLCDDGYQRRSRSVDPSQAGASDFSGV